jgi:tetratricopeptide (TPR) repeat protein
VDADFESLAGERELPSYDAVGRGLYHALRRNPGCAFASRYAGILRDGYPHVISEIASQIVMLERKDVEVPYLDRMIASLRIFALLEPENPRFPLEIGLVYREKGLRLSALNQATPNLYRAESFLRRAVELSPGTAETLFRYAEVEYLLGRYEEAARLWEEVLPELVPEKRAALSQRLGRIAEGKVPLVPVVDYLEAVGIAFAAYEEQDFEEAAAILRDVLADEAFSADFPVPEIRCLLGRCYERLGMPRYAEEAYREALSVAPEDPDAAAALAAVTGGA